MSQMATMPPSLPNNCSITVVGGGFSGVYTAWRIAHSMDSPVDPTNICLFEATNRVGGRIFTLTKDLVPELGDNIIEAGYYRYHSGFNFAIRDLIDYFKIPTECYFGISPMKDEIKSRPLTDRIRKPEKECKIKDHYYLLRNLLLKRDDIENSYSLPYMIREKENWNSTEKLDSLFHSAISDASGGLIEDIVPSDKVTNIEDFIQRFETSFERLLNATYKGVPLHTIDVRTVLEDKFKYSSEFYSAIRDLEGAENIDAILSLNVLNLMCHYVRMLHLSPLGSYRKIKSGEGRVGFTTLIDKMVQDLQNRGVQIFKEHLLTDITRPDETRPGEVDTSGNGDETRNDMKPIRKLLKLKFLNGVETVTNRLVLAIGNHQLKKLNPTSVIFRESSEDFINIVSNLKDVGAHKLYLYYDNAFWKNMKNSVLKTSNWVREIRYFDSPLSCDTTGTERYDEFDRTKPEKKCSGFLELSYAIGHSSWETEVFDILNTVTTSPLNVLRDSNEREALILARLHQEVIDLHKDLVDLTNLETPKLGLFINWHKNSFFRAGVVNQPTNVDSIRHFITVTEPVKNIHMVNPDFLFEDTWETGFDYSLLLPETWIKMKLGMGKPDWMSETIYNVIVKYSDRYVTQVPETTTKRK